MATDSRRATTRRATPVAANEAGQHLGIDACESMLGAMLVTVGAIPVALRIVDDDDPYLPKHRLILAAMRSLYGAHQGVDETTLCAELERKGALKDSGDKKYVCSLRQLCPVAGHVRHYAETVREMASLRELAAAGQELAADVSRNGRSSADLVSRHQERLRTLTQRTASSDGKRFVVLDPREAKPSRPVALVPGRVFRGGLTIVGGRQGDGKSKVMRDLAARATRGGPWPFGSPECFEPLIWLDLSAEDDYEEVIVPEYIAAGANLDCLRIINARQDGLFPKLSDPAQLRQLEELIVEMDADVVAIDPVSHFFPGVKINEAESVIAALSPLMQVAKRTRTAIIPVTHFGKSMTADALSKFLGSGQWTAISRSALGVVLDPDNQDPNRERRQLWSVKCNIAKRSERQPWGFEIVEGKDKRAVVAWDAQPAITSEAAAFNLESRRKGPDSKEARAKAWLLTFLADGKLWRSAVLCDKAATEGHASWAVMKALKNNPEFVQKPVGHGYKQGTTVEWGLASALQ